jgi:hypothetical protein
VPPPRRRQSRQRRGAQSLSAPAGLLHDQRLAQKHRPPRPRRSDQGVRLRLVPYAGRCVGGADRGDDERP